MKKKTVLKVLAMLLVFVLSTSNVFASVAPLQTLAGEVENDAVTEKTVEVKVEGTAVPLAGNVATVPVSGGAVTIAVSGYATTSSSNVYISEALSKQKLVTISGTDTNVTITVNVDEATETATVSIGKQDILVSADGVNGAYWDKTATVTVTVPGTTPGTTPETTPGTTPGTTPSDTLPDENAASPEEVEKASEAADKLSTAIADVTTAEEIDTIVGNITENEVDAIVKTLNDNAEGADFQAEYAEIAQKAAEVKGVTETVTADESAENLVIGMEVLGLALNVVDETSEKLGLNVTSVNSSASDVEAAVEDAMKDVIEKISANANVSGTLKVGKKVSLDISVVGLKATGKLAAPVIITMPIPNGISSDALAKNRIRILHFVNGLTNKPNTISPVNKGGKMSFAVDHFSTFVIVEIEDEDDEPTPTPTPTPSTSTGGNTSTGNSGSGRPSYSRPTSSSSSSSSSLVNAGTVGWIKSATGYRYRLANGTYPVNQWLMIDNKWYFFDGNTNMAEGWKMINSKWYYLNPTDGDMAEGWKMVNGKWYYLNPTDGDMATGWKVVDGKWYYLDPVNGDCFMNTTTPDGYRVDENGAWIQ